MFPELLVSQITFDQIPIDQQLVPRDLTTNLGKIIINGQSDQSGVNYQKVKVLIKKDGAVYDMETKNLNYNNNIASFNFEFDIQAELTNYTIEVYGIQGGTETLVHSVQKVVAGDVYIIQGQSNAEARIRDVNDSSSGYISDFIRVYASGTDVESSLVSDDHWYIGDGDADRKTSGNTGQWGLTLASLINAGHGIPVAIFNGAHGGRNINFFQRPSDYESNLQENYSRLYYRLSKTGLKDHVRAIIWSQGEQDGIIGTNPNTYTNRFWTLFDAWKEDYASTEHVYLFQTSKGCGAPLDDIMVIKEAQRSIAESNPFIDIIPTSALDNINDDCHFFFQNGYEEFGKRVYALVDHQLYGNPTNLEISAPNITKVYLTDNQTIVVETDAESLIKDGDPVTDYVLHNGNNAVVSNIEVVGSSFILQLDKDPGSNATLSYTGPNVNGFNRFIRNSNGLEMISFYAYPVDGSRFTVWDGNTWSNGNPSASKYVTIAGNYNGASGGFKALDLTVDTGVDLNFDTGSDQSIEVFGNLVIDGSFVIGDTESLVMYDDGAMISGKIFKKERSTNRSNAHDITYWSSPVTNESIENVFNSVNPSRIFYFDQNKSAASDPSENGYWDIWQIASGNMAPGVGYAAEGPIGTTGIHNISFWGIPNNGVITYELKGHFGDDDSSGDHDNNFNLIGNPYPSAIKITDFFDANSSLIDETVYLWTHSTPVSEVVKGDFVSSDYATFNRSGGTACISGGAIPRDTIGSGQGFFIRATSPGTLNFNNTMRRPDQNTLFFKAVGVTKKERPVQKERIRLNMKTDEGGFSQILINFTADATFGFDKGYDAQKIVNSNPVSFFSMVQGRRYTIQGLPPLPFDENIKLGFQINVAPRKLSIGIDKIEGKLNNVPIILVDHELHIVHNLKEADYYFDVQEKVDCTDRFTLQFNNRVLQDPVYVKRSKISSLFLDQDEIRIEANSIIKRVKIYDILGETIVDQQCDNESVTLDLNHPLSRGILIISILFEDGSTLIKKVINH